MAQQPEFGLIQVVAVDPTAGAGVPGLPYEFLYRTDNGTLYIKTGSADTAWTLVAIGAPSSSGGAGGIAPWASFLVVPGWGDLDFSGGVVAGLTPTGAPATYYTLTQDVCAENITVGAGYTVETNGYRFMCTGTMTNNGVVHNNGADGNDAAGAVSGAGGAGGSGGIFAAGGNGATSPGPNNQGVAGTAITNHPRLPNVYSASSTNLGGGTNANGQDGNIVGRGGGGGGAACCGISGGSGGNITQRSVNDGTLDILSLTLGSFQLATVYPIRFQVSTGGGSGGGTAGAGTGGGGGGGGVLVCQAGQFAGGGVYQSMGGNGGNGSFSGAAGNAGGGGGGGGGGLVVLVGGGASSIVPNVDGGEGGLGATNGTVAGNGGAGADGHYILKS